MPAPSNLAEEIALLEEKAGQETQRIYQNLSPWQKVLVARHPNRPHTKDYLENVFDLPKFRAVYRISFVCSKMTKNSTKKKK